MSDTTAYVGFKCNNVEAEEIILRAERILFSAVVLGELMFGFRNSLIQFQVARTIHLNRTKSRRNRAGP